MKISRLVVIGISLLVLCILVQAGKLYFTGWLDASATVSQGVLYSSALKGFVKTHEVFPGRLCQKSSREELLSYAPDFLQPSSKVVSDPQHVFALLTSEGRWGAEPGGIEGDIAAFVFIPEGVTGGWDVVLYESGPVLENQQESKPVSLAGRATVSISGVRNRIPDNLLPPEVSLYLKQNGT